MDPDAIERARQKAEAVRASLQRKQHNIVASRRLEPLTSMGTAEAAATVPSGGIVTAEASKASTSTETNAKKNADAPATSIRETAVQRSGRPSSRPLPPPPVMEDFTASANDDDDDNTSDDDEDDTASTFHDDEESSTAHGSGATGAGTATTGVVASTHVPQSKEVRFSLSNDLSETELPETQTTGRVPEATLPSETKQDDIGAAPTVRATDSGRNASVTRQVLSSSSESVRGSVQGREPRYLLYRDSLRTSLQKPASAARSSLTSSEDTSTTKNQLLSYFDKSLPPVQPESRRANVSNNGRAQEEVVPVATLPYKAVEIEGDGLALKSSKDTSSPTVATSPVVKESSPTTDDKEATADTTVASKAMSEDKKSQTRSVSFDPSSDALASPRLEDPSESEHSYQAGTLTARQYRRRRIMQLGALVFLLVALPLAIGLGVSYANRPSSSGTNSSALPVSSSVPTTSISEPSIAPSAALVAVPAPTIAPAQTTSLPLGAFTDPPTPTSATQTNTTGSPSIFSNSPTNPTPTQQPTEIVFAPITSILDLLAPGNSTGR